MAIAELPVWPFAPDWASPVTENLEWLTDVLMSPSGAEQRRALRPYARRSFNFTTVLEGEDRNLYDLLVMANGSGLWYAPLWFHATVVQEPTAGNTIVCSPSLGLGIGTPIIILTDRAYDYRLAEISAVTDTSIVLANALGTVVPAGALVYPMTKGRLIEMPNMTAITDTLGAAEVNFRSIEATVLATDDSWLEDTYRGFYVLPRESDWSDGTERSQQRILQSFDTTLAPEVVADTAGRPFPTLRMNWFLDGQDDHARFYALMQTLKGRAVPVWLPTWMTDLRPVADIAATDSSITVARCGLTLAGGPFPERQDVMIELLDGQRFYRRLTSATMSSGNEILGIDTPLGVDVTPREIVRVSYMSLMRLDHDSIDIDHITDTDGMSEIQVTFRSAPDIRVPSAGF